MLKINETVSYVGGSPKACYCGKTYCDYYTMKRKGVLAQAFSRSRQARRYAEHTWAVARGLAVVARLTAIIIP